MLLAYAERALLERKELGHVRLDRLHLLVTGNADTVIAVLDEV